MTAQERRNIPTPVTLRRYAEEVGYTLEKRYNLPSPTKANVKPYWVSNIPVFEAARRFAASQGNSQAINSHPYREAVVTLSLAEIDIFDEMIDEYLSDNAVPDHVIAAAKTLSQKVNSVREQLLDV